MVASHRDGVSESSFSSEDELVENSNQQNPLRGAVYSTLPEGLHMLFVCRILKTLRKNKSIRKYEMRGSLLDKMCGQYVARLAWK